VDGGADNNDNDDDSNDGSLSSVDELLSSVVSTRGSIATDLRHGRTSKRFHERDRGKNVAGASGSSLGGREGRLGCGIGADLRTVVSISSPKVADSENGKDDIEDEEGLRSVERQRFPPPYGHSV
jgi:hypothetical protein